MSQSLKFDKSLEFRNYQWKTRDGFISIKNMSYMHLINTLKLVRNISKEYENNICGATKEVWINNIKSELKYRDILANNILFKFTLKGKTGNISMKTIIEAAEKGFYVDKDKKIIQMGE